MERPLPGTPLELRYLVKALINVPEWYELGLRLGIDKHDLKRINQDNRKETERCKSAMLSEWLNNGLDHSWEKLDTAAKAVTGRSNDKRRRDEEEERQQEEVRKTLEAVRRIEKSIKRMNVLVDECAEEKSKLIKKLDMRKKKWEDFQSKWRDEEKEWKRQESQRQRIKEAITAGNFRASGFVCDYLVKKGVPQHVSKEAVECCLRIDVLHQEMVRAKQLLTRQKHIKNHQRALTHIQQDYERWLKQLEDHRQMLKLDSLEQMGLKTEKINELRKHLKELGHALSENKSALEFCDRALEETQDQKLIWEFCKFLGSFKQSIKKLEQSSRALTEHITSLKESQSQLERKTIDLEKAVKVAAGATVGAVIGGAAVEGATIGAAGGLVGIVVGALVGIGAGAIMFRGRSEGQLRELRQELETIKTERSASEKIARESQRIEADVQPLLQTFQDANCL